MLKRQKQNKVILKSTASAVVVFVTLQVGAAFAELNDIRTEIFSELNRSILCPRQASQVAPEALATVLFETVDNSLTVSRHLGPGSIGRQALRFFGAKEPFVERIDEIPDQVRQQILKRALDQRTKIYDDLADVFRNTEGRPKFGYLIKRSERPRGDFVTGFFAGGSQLRILCVTPQVQSPRTQGRAETIALPIRLRGKIDDLAKDAGSAQFKSASSATVSFVSNDELDEESFEVDVVAGYVFQNNSDYVANEVIPFSQYQSSRTTVSSGTTDRVEVLGFGFLYNRFQIFNSSRIIPNFNLGLRPTATFDLAQKSETAGVKAYLAPGAVVGDVSLAQENDIFGGPAKSGWLLLYPDIRLIAEAVYVADAGINPNIDDEDEYASIGVEPLLEFALNTKTPVDRIRLSANYRIMKVFSTEIDEVERYELGAKFNLDEAGNLNIGVSYVDGENPDTFQDEKFWNVKFGVKF